MSGAVEESAVVALEALYSGPMQGRELSQAREIFAYLRSNGQVSHIGTSRGLHQRTAICWLQQVFLLCTRMLLRPARFRVCPR